MTDDVAGGSQQPEQVWETLGQEIAFEITYDVGDSRHATITIDMPNTFIDTQLVVLDDPLIPFTVEAEVELGRLVRLELNCHERNHEPWSALPKEIWLGSPGDLPDLYEEQITQKDLQRSFVVLIKNWAVCGREAQWAVADEAERIGRKLTVAELKNVVPELGNEPQRLHASQEDALKYTLKALTSFHTGKRRRARDEDGEALLERVAREYKDAVARGVRAPRALVAERLQYHPAHVGRLLSKARELGMLPPAKPRGRRKGGHEVNEDS